MIYGYGFGHGFSIFGELFSLIVWVVIIWFVISLIRRNHAGKGGCCGGVSAGLENLCGKKADSATELLRQRFAKGEISKEEFEEKLQVLEGKKTV